jgi:hypothetical protein
MLFYRENYFGLALAIKNLTKTLVIRKGMTVFLRSKRVFGNIRKK